MALSSCISLSNQTSPFHIDETRTHGTPEFPAAIYRDDVTTNIVNWHWHAEIEIGYVETGIVLLESGNRKYILAEGDLFFIKNICILSFIIQMSEILPRNQIQNSFLN